MFPYQGMFFIVWCYTQHGAPEYIILRVCRKYLPSRDTSVVYVRVAKSDRVYGPSAYLREVYWMFLYGLTSNDTFFESVVRRVSASDDTSWVTSSTRSVIRLASRLHPQRVAEYNVAPWRSTNV